MKNIRRLLRKLGIRKAYLKRLVNYFFLKYGFLKSHLSNKKKIFIKTNDPIRYGAIFLALKTIEKENISGSLAECGVYRGISSKFIHDQLPDRKLYLFDTFSGFDIRDSDTINDNRFTDTSIKQVLNFVGNSNNIIIKQGYFPETTLGLEKEEFCFVMLDMDKYEPTLAGLEFFYPHMKKGGYIFIHDYNSTESNHACLKAVDNFLKDKIESVITIPDRNGTAIFRKI